MKLNRLVIFSLLACTAGLAQSRNAADAQKDSILRAMLSELQRNTQQLQFQGLQKPYFIQYRLDDQVEYEASASYGAQLGEQEQHRRIVRVTVRVGDYKSDSSGGRGDGSLQVAPIDDNPLALQTALWFATDSAYKNALREYTQKQAALRSVQTPPDVDDFSREKATVWIGPAIALDLDKTAWKKRIAEASALYRTDATARSFERDTLYSNAHLRGFALNRYLVNSEGTIVREGHSGYQALIALGAQAADGMRLDRNYASTARSAGQLDSEQKFHEETLKLLLSLRDLRAAPVIADEYHGPVLLSGDAASDVVNQLLAGPLSASRPELGTSARTRGPFASSYRARVLADFLKITDDPLIKDFGGKQLVGAYDVDDEGVPAQAVPLIEAGRLMNYLVAREPIKDFPSSNGHGRAPGAGPARAQPGVLKVEASPAASAEELQAKLAATAKEQGLDFAYYAETLGPELRPRLLYRVHLADGKRELVRGSAFDDLDQRALRTSILAAGNDTYVDNNLGDVPSTTLAPSLLLGDITLKRAQERSDKLPYYPPPD